jgi:hypothetical protein
LRSLAPGCRGNLALGNLPRRSTLRSLSTPAAVRRVSTVLSDACPLAVHRCFLLSRAKAARLQGVPPRDGFTGFLRPCGLWSRTASLGFIFSRASSFRAPAEGLVRALCRGTSRSSTPVGRTTPGQVLVASSSPFASRLGTLAFRSIEDRLVEGSFSVSGLTGTAPVGVGGVVGGRGRRVLSGRADLPMGRTRRTAWDGDEEGRGFSGRGTRQVAPLRVPRDHPGGFPLDFCLALVAWHLVSPTGRSEGPRAPLDGFRFKQARGLPQPEVGILSILVTPWG